MDLLDKLRSTFDAFRGELHGLRREIEKAQQQREDLLSQPAARADIANMLCQWVDVEREQFLQTLGARLRADIASPKLDLASADSVRRHTQSNYLGVTPQGAGGVATSAAIDATLAGLFAPALKDALAAAVGEMDWPGPEGSPMTARAEKVAALDAKIDALREKEAELVHVAAEARVVID